MSAVPREERTGLARDRRGPLRVTSSFRNVKDVSRYTYDSGIERVANFANPTLRASRTTHPRLVSGQQELLLTTTVTEAPAQIAINCILNLSPFCPLLDANADRSVP